MVEKDSIDMYLVAIKSFMHNFGSACIEAINDGSLSKEDIALIKHHIPEISIHNAAEVDTMSCPDYISWKRLFRIIELSQNAYVIQLDSDIVATAPLVEVYHKAISNEGFMIADGRWPCPVNLELMSEIASRWPQEHPQARAEQIFREIEHFSSTEKYIRGCAGFCGYPKGSLSYEKVMALSKQVEARIGRKVWESWGSEQTATNALISASNNPEVLAWPRYQNYLFPPAPDSLPAAALLHFIGTNRYKDSYYTKAVKQLLSQIE